MQLRTNTSLGILPTKTSARGFAIALATGFATMLFAPSCGGDSQVAGQADAGADAAPGEISEQCREEDRADSYSAGMTLVGDAGYRVELVGSLPAPLEKGDHEWELRVTDAQGNLAPGLELKAAPYMPDHGHGTPRLVVPEERGDGSYVLAPVNLFMPGYWTVKVRLFEAESELDSVTFRFCI